MTSQPIKQLATQAVEALPPLIRRPFTPIGQPPPRAALRTLLSPSTYSSSSSGKPSRARSLLSATLLISSTGLVYAYYGDSRALAHEKVVMPAIRAVMDAEESHKLAVKVLSLPAWARPKDTRADAAELRTELFGLEVSNPIGMAAGFDKDAEAIDGLFDLGFGYVEIGSVTPEPQPGNPKPRFFRLLEDDSVINRYGFNSLGHASALSRLQSRIRSFAFSHPSLYPSPSDVLTSSFASHPTPPPNLPRSLIPGRLLGINLGKNKSSAAESDEDYLQGVRTFGEYADVLIINVSSPNTPGLRLLQGGNRLGQLLTSVVKERDVLKTVDGVRPKVVVKVAPDLEAEDIRDVAKAVKESAVDGVIVSNTTITRPDYLKSASKSEIGGLSGPPVKPLALLAVSRLRALLPPSTPIIGCGGISSGSDALEFAQAGASAVQLYTSFGFRGVGLPALIKDEVAEELGRRGGVSWMDVVQKGKEKREVKEVVGLEERRKVGGVEGLKELVGEAEKALSR